MAKRVIGQGLRFRVHLTVILENVLVFITLEIFYFLTIRNAKNTYKNHC